MLEDVNNMAGSGYRAKRLWEGSEKRRSIYNGIAYGGKSKYIAK
jgi:hypothetical protein